jgi:CBS domain-containing protein
MQVSHICSRSVDHTARNVPIIEAARRMREGHVGDLVVVEERGGKTLPIGILTDRDLVVAVLAQDADHLRVLDVGDVMGALLVTATEDEDLEDVLHRMQTFAVRRVPIVDGDGALCGILSVDDIVVALSDEIGRLADLVSRQPRREREQRP